LEYIIIIAIGLAILAIVTNKAAKQTIFGKINKYRLRDKFQPLPEVDSGEITRTSADVFTVWEEPNVAETPTLHIGESGERYSTLTGVSWLDNETFIVNHRSGLKMAIFDLKDPSMPVWTGALDYPTDDIAAKRIDATTWEVCVSGCWSAVYGRYQIRRSATDMHAYEARLLETLAHAQRDFCHGVDYDDENLCYSIHTGKRPRVTIGVKTYKLPFPWGVRDMCFDRKRNRHILVAVSANPKKTAYGNVVTSLWTLSKGATKWECLSCFNNFHSDALDVCGDHIWLPDQLNDHLVAVDAETGKAVKRYSGDSLSFPHGLGISPDGMIAVTNYGTSSVTIVDAARLLDR